MTIIGLDVSKKDIIGVAITKRTTVKATYSIENTKEDIAGFLHEVINTFKHPVFGSEATAEYHNLVAQSCLERNLPFFVLNPIITKQFTKATIRKKKTDLTDAHVIAKCILQGEGERAHPSSFEPTKPILRTASELSRLCVAVSHMQQRFARHFADEKLIQRELKELEKHIETSMVRIRSHGSKRVNKAILQLLCSIPGIGNTLAATIAAEIGSLERFSCAKALAAYAGLDPKVRQSGIALKRNTKLTKRGSPYLRRAAFIAASIAQRCDPDLKTYYEKKRGEGKRYREATVANARHILYRVYAVWKRKTPYVKKSTVNA